MCNGEPAWMNRQAVLDSSRPITATELALARADRVNRARTWLAAGQAGLVPMDQAEAAALRLLERDRDNAPGLMPGEAAPAKRGGPGDAISPGGLPTHGSAGDRGSEGE